ncbi:MAG TPA: DUF1634 domain-containing protein [Terriglobales bacterium]|nr:DUF1634 domain-containing protein [Terriglobales bacterium]
MFRKSDWTDQKIEVIIANLLRIGVMSAAVIVLAGGVVFLARHGVQPARYGSFAGEPSNLTRWRGILQAALGLRARGIIQLGLLILIATPVARVAFSVAAFALERDWLYVGVAGFVLMVLLYSLLGSGL